MCVEAAATEGGRWCCGGAVVADFENRGDREVVWGENYRGLGWFWRRFSGEGGGFLAGGGVVKVSG